MQRDNQNWLADLSLDGAERDTALGDLRAILMRNTRKALSGNNRVDDPFLEDAVQDALVRILDRLNQFAGRSRFVTWATTIAIRIALTELRRKRWRDVSLDDVVADAEIPMRRAVNANVGPEIQAERTAVLETIHKMIQFELTNKQRTVLLAELKGMPQDEIARHLGSNRNAICKMGHDPFVVQAKQQVPAPTDCGYGCDTTTPSGYLCFGRLAGWRLCLPQRMLSAIHSPHLESRESPCISQQIGEFLGRHSAVSFAVPLRRIHSTGVPVSDRSNLLLEVFARSCPLKKRRGIALQTRHEGGSLSVNQFRMKTGIGNWNWELVVVGIGGDWGIGDALYNPFQNIRLRLNFFIL